MTSPARTLLPFALLAGTLAACGGEVIVGDPQPSAIGELEPNDDAWSAQPIGSLRAGDFLAIEGHVTECCPDPADGFAFYAEEPLELRFALYAYEPADLDFCIYDPYEERYLACYESAFDPELGTFLVGGPGELHVIVAAWLGDAHYRLEIEARPLAYPATAEPAPAAVPSAPFEDYATPPLERELKKTLRQLLGARDERRARASKEKATRDPIELRAGPSGE